MRREPHLAGLATLVAGGLHIWQSAGCNGISCSARALECTAPAQLGSPACAASTMQAGGAGGGAHLVRHALPCTAVHDWLAARSSSSFFCVCSREEQLEAYTSIVNVHGELVLLCHWSMCAYTGIVKVGLIHGGCVCALCPAACQAR